MARSESKWRDESKPHLELWEESENPSVAYVFVLDYHLLPQGERRKRPAHLIWPKRNYSKVYNFNYSMQDVRKMEGLLRPNSLKELADVLLDQLNDTIKNVLVILVGYGYGGIICEQMALSLEEKHLDIRGIVLMGTPHFREGLAQWATICANKIKDTAEFEKRSDYKTVIDDISERQNNFHRKFGERNAAVKVACCFARNPDNAKSTDQNVSPEWCILSGFRANDIDATYSQMIGFTTEVDYSRIGTMIDTWVQGTWKRRSSVSSDTPSFCSRKSLALDPRIKWEHPRVKVDASVTIGTIVASRVDMGVLAIGDEIREETAKLGCSLDSSTAAPIRWHADELTKEKDDKESRVQLTRQSAYKYAREAIRLPKVKDHLKSGATAYLVVGTSSPTEAHGQATSSQHIEVEKVQLWPIKGRRL